MGIKTIICGHTLKVLHFDNWHPEEVNSFKVVGIFDEGCSNGFELSAFIYE